MSTIVVEKPANQKESVSHVETVTIPTQFSLIDGGSAGIYLNGELIATLNTGKKTHKVFVAGDYTIVIAANCPYTAVCTDVILAAAATDMSANITTPMLVNITGGAEDEKCVAVIATLTDPPSYMRTDGTVIDTDTLTVSPVTDLADCCAEPVVPFDPIELIFDTPQETQVDVPEGATELKIFTYGAGGSRSHYYSPYTEGQAERNFYEVGGAGGLVSGIINVSALTQSALTIVVGTGQTGSAFTGFGSGGNGSFYAYDYKTSYGGSGGGYSAVFDGAVKTNTIVLAGGGGGAGSSNSLSQIFSGGLGGGFGTDGDGIPSAANGGKSGGAGGAGGTGGGGYPNGDNGVSFQGGNGGNGSGLYESHGGGGGGGFIGGGGGAFSTGIGAGGGGGGSGYLNPSVTPISAVNGGGGAGGVAPTVVGDVTTGSPENGKVRLVWS